MDEQAVQSPWFVLQTKPNALDVARENLARQGYRSFMPLQRIATRTSRGPRHSLKPLFPGYLFFTQAENDFNWRAVGNTRGILRVLMGPGGSPARLPDQVLAELEAMTDENGLVTAVARYAVGDEVRIVNGPMSGWVARVMQLTDMERIRLLLDVMGRAVPMDVALRDLQPASHAAG